MLSEKLILSVSFVFCFLPPLASDFCDCFSPVQMNNTACSVHTAEWTTNHPLRVPRVRHLQPADVPQSRAARRASYLGQLAEFPSPPPKSRRLTARTGGKSRCFTAAVAAGRPRARSLTASPATCLCPLPASPASPFMFCFQDADDPARLRMGRVALPARMRTLCRSAVAEMTDAFR